MSISGPVAQHVPVERLDAGDRPQKLHLAVALGSGDAEDLAPVHREVDRSEPVALQPGDLEADLGSARGPSRDRGTPARAAGRSSARRASPRTSRPRRTCPGSTPSRSTVIRSAIPSTSGSRWLTYMTPTPARLRSNTSAWSCSIPSGPSAVVGSSRSSTFGCASKCLHDLEQLPLGEREAPGGHVRRHRQSELLELRAPPRSPCRRRQAAGSAAPPGRGSRPRTSGEPASRSGTPCPGRGGSPRPRTPSVAGARRSRSSPRRARGTRSPSRATSTSRDPFSPTSAWISPARQSTLTSRTARTAPKALGDGAQREHDGDRGPGSRRHQLGISFGSSGTCAASSS